MIEKKIKALKDVTLNTHFKTHLLSKDEVKKIEFRNIDRFKDLLTLGHFVEVDESEEEVKVIPVIQAPIDDIVEEPEQKLPFVEAIQDHNDLDEAGESMEQCTPEDLRRVEPLQVEEKIEEVVKEPVSEEILEDLSQTDAPRTEEEIERAATEGMVEMGFEAQSVDEVPVEEIDYRNTTEGRPTDTPDATDTEDSVEVEEIPIEEQDESKPKL